MQRSLTNYHIKLLAALLMLIDHVGVVFFPQLMILRVIGRLSFPLFAWLLVQGEAHTRDIWRYGVRLLLFGIVSQFTYYLAFDETNPNILFTLLIGLICLRSARILPPLLQLLPWIGGVLVATLSSSEYEGYGIALIAIIRYFKNDWIWWMSWIGLHLILVFTDPSFGRFQFYAIFSGLIFQLANHQQGAKARWFYFFYPGHLLVLYLIYEALNPGG